MQTTNSYIIYGYAPTGEAVYHKLLVEGKKVTCFCEDSLVEREATATDIAIYSLEEIVSKDISGIFIVCVANYQNITQKLLQHGINDWILACDILTDADVMDVSYATKAQGMAVRQVKSCLQEQALCGNENYLLMRNLDLVVTERCSMKCRDCSNLMQYYKKPRDYSLEEIICWIDELLQYVDEIIELRILGGEPFMNGNLANIMHGLLPKNQIKYITIYSNAMIMPTREMWDAVSHDKFGFSITDYGVRSQRLREICQELEKRHIAYDVHPCGKWTQCSLIHKHNRSASANQSIYNECCGKNLTTLLNGKIYKCPFMANAMNLKAIPQEASDFISVSSLSNLSLIDARKVISDYLHRGYYASCDFCMGRSYSDVAIEPAIQTATPLSYQEV